MQPPHLDPLADETIDAAAAILQALAPPLRLRIVMHALQREVSVQDLIGSLGTTYSTLTRHARHLRTAGLLRRRRRGNRIVYQTAPHVIGLVREAVNCARPASATTVMTGTR